MPRAVATIVILLVLTNTVGLSAQVAAGPRPSPFSRESINRAVASVVRDGATTTLQGRSDWQRVREIRLGTVITVTVVGTLPATRVLLASDDNGLNLLYEDATLPLAVREALSELASLDPDMLVTLATAGSWTSRATKVRIASEGVFVDDKKVADLSRLVVRVNRSDIREVLRGRTRDQIWGGVWRLLGATIAGSALIQGIYKLSGNEPRGYGRGVLASFGIGLGWTIVYAVRKPNTIYRR